METLQIIVAICASVFLLLKFVASPNKVRLSAGERLPKAMLMHRLAVLGKRCSQVGRGFGLSFGNVELKRIIRNTEKKIQRNIELDAWEIEFYNARTQLLKIFEKAKTVARRSYVLGHVDGVPRLCLLCEEIANSTQGDISARVLIDATVTFEKNSPLTDVERNFFVDMLRLCICKLMYCKADHALKRSEMYDVGRNDGAGGKIDLDRIRSVDYVCGVRNAARSNDIAAIERLLENNGIDAESASDDRRKFLAEVCATVQACVRALALLEKYNALFCVSSMLPRLKSKSSAKNRLAVDIVPPISISMSAVAACMFVPAEYAAVFVVSSILIYALFRFKTLFNASELYYRSISDTVDLIKSKLTRRRNDPPRKLRSALSETAYFGDDPTYAVNETRGASADVCSDNRGKIRLKPRNRTDSMRAEELELVLCTKDGDVRLASCDCVFERHKSVYRAFSERIEVCAEILPAFDHVGCCCKYTVINRTDDNIEEDLFAVLSVFASDERRTLDISDKRALCSVGDGDALIAVAFDDTAEYFDRLPSGLCKYYYDTRYDGARFIVGRRTVSVDPFSRAEICFYVVYGKSKREIERYADAVIDASYYARTEDVVRAYCNSGESMQARYGDTPRRYDVGTRLENLGRGRYPDPRIKSSDYDIGLRCGGFLRGGEYSVSAENCGIYEDYKTLLFGDGLGAEFSVRGIRNIFTVTDTKRRLLCNDVYVAIGEGDHVWSPTVRPCGYGSSETVFGFSSVRYSVAHNGCVSTLKCATVKGKNALLFDLEIENTENIEREFDVMLALALNRDAEVAFKNDALSIGTGDDGIFITASEKICDHAKYKEAYFVRGSIDRASGFRNGGSSVAPAVSVRTELRPLGTARVVFCIGLRSDGATEVDKIDGSRSDDAFLSVEKYFDNYWRVVLNASDRALNHIYKHSFYQAYTCGFLFRGEFSIKDRCILCSAAKYIDPCGVKRCLTDIMAAQNENGEIKGLSENGIYLAWAVIDYVEFTRDHGFLDKAVKFASRRSLGRNISVCGAVSAHCVGAVLYSLENMSADNGLCAQIFIDKAALEILRYFSNCFARQPDGKNRYARQLSDIAERLGEELKRVRTQVFYKLNGNEDAVICARALYYSGDYEKAYNILKYNSPISRYERSDTDRTAANAPYEFETPVVAALYYTAVTELLLGIRISGRHIKISPRIASNAPTVAFDLVNGEERAHITIDNKKSGGDWRMRVGEIDYPADGVSLEKLNDKSIVFYRSGE